MGKDWYQQHAFAREIFQRADDIVGYSLSTVCFEGPEDELKQTRITQPAIFVHSMVVATWLHEQGIEPDITAGHSLGEYSALVAAGAADFDSILKAVQRRGELMQEASQKHPGIMAAIIGLTFEDVVQICRQAESVGIVVPANLNSPGQVAISGTMDGVRRAMEIAKNKGARRVQELEVSGAFHSPLMQPARDGLEQVLDQLKLRTLRLPVVVNVSAQPVTDIDTIRQSLKNQLTSPVLWEPSVRRMVEMNADRMAEIGPGKVLQGLIRRTDRHIQLFGCDTVEQALSLTSQLRVP
jgi:[acyl-carrier-protein] S-malonyltransferase